MKTKFFKEWGKKQWIVIGVTLAVTISFGAAFWYSNQQSKIRQEAIANAQNAINERWNKWEALSDDYQERMNFFSSFYGETYTADANYPEVADLYNQKRDAMKKWFVVKFNNVLETNIINDVEKSDDKNKINQSLKNLDIWKSYMKSDGDLFFDETTKEKWLLDCNSLTDSYRKKVAAIEQEEKEKAEEQKRQQSESTHSTVNQQSGQTAVYGGNITQQQSNSVNTGCTIHKVNGEYLYNGECGVVNCSTVPGTNLCYIEWMEFTDNELCENFDYSQGGSCSHFKKIWLTPDYKQFGEKSDGSIIQF